MRGHSRENDPAGKIESFRHGQVLLTEDEKAVIRHRAVKEGRNPEEAVREAEEEALGGGGAKREGPAERFIQQTERGFDDVFGGET